jgi:hypothetical protein
MINIYLQYYHSRENTRSFIIVCDLYLPLLTGQKLFFFGFHAKHFGSFLDFTEKSWMGTKNIVPTLFISDPNDSVEKIQEALLLFLRD